MTTPLLEAALEYAAADYPVLPMWWITEDGTCACGSTTCALPGCHALPVEPDGSATCNADTIRGWWEEYPDANIGLAVGPEARLLAIEVDTAKVGADPAALPGGLATSETCTVYSGTRTWYLFSHPATALAHGRNALAAGIHAWTAKGLIPAPLSRLKSGEQVEHGNTAVPALPEPPPELRELLRPTEATPESKRTWLEDVRLATGLSREHLADHLGLRRTYLRTVCSGKNPFPQGWDLVMIAALGLGVDPSDCPGYLIFAAQEPITAALLQYSAQAHLEKNRVRYGVDSGVLPEDAGVELEAVRDDLIRALWRYGAGHDYGEWRKVLMCKDPFPLDAPAVAAVSRLLNIPAGRLLPNDDMVKEVARLQREDDLFVLVQLLQGAHTAFGGDERFRKGPLQAFAKAMYQEGLGPIGMEVIAHIAMATDGAEALRVAAKAVSKGPGAFCAWLLSPTSTKRRTAFTRRIKLEQVLSQLKALSPSTAPVAFTPEIQLRKSPPGRTKTPWPEPRRPLGPEPNKYPQTWKDGDGGEIRKWSAETIKDLVRDIFTWRNDWVPRACLRRAITDFTEPPCPKTNAYEYIKDLIRAGYLRASDDGSFLTLADPGEGWPEAPPQ